MTPTTVAAYTPQHLTPDDRAALRRRVVEHIDPDRVRPADHGALWLAGAVWLALVAGLALWVLAVLS
ncbi:MAG: hypothetical protein ACRCWF_05570 [Beijerinckiaceae bacterium]